MKMRHRVLSRLGWTLVTMSRGLAFFFGAYAALSLVGVVFGGSYNTNSWWIDLSLLPPFVYRLAQISVTCALLLFCFKVPRKLVWRIVGTVICVFFGCIALQNALKVFEVAERGLVTLGFPVPFSLFIMCAFVLLALAMFFGHRALPAVVADVSQVTVVSKAEEVKKKAPSRLATVVVSGLTLMLCGVAFPLGQIFCFGLTDYRTPVDAVVIFGAQVYSDGRLSMTLANRVNAGIELYEQGYTPVLIMSGGTGWEGVNEAEAMKNYAIDKGVPASAILVDGQGNTSELTVVNTLAIAEQQGFKRIGAVSSFYHLARIKMLYQHGGQDVSTVPASSAGEGGATLRAAMREIPGWWYYWFGNIFR